MRHIRVRRASWAWRFCWQNGSQAARYLPSPGVGLGFIEPNTNLTTGDLLATAVEMLLDQVDPSGPKPLAPPAARKPMAARPGRPAHDCHDQRAPQRRGLAPHPADPA